MSSRREFIRLTVSGAVVAGLNPLLRGADALAAPAGMDLLVLGGTGFIGPHLVRHAVARGHRVTIFTRGRRDPALPDGIERLIGDRNGQLDALKGKRWDAVIDDSATNPDWVRMSTELLKDSVRNYLFTSSTGVYYPYLQRGVTEATPGHYDLPDPKDLSESFGVSKAKCEQQVQTVFGDRGIIIRPTYIVGPGDTSDRFPYWPVRLAHGGEVLAPGRRNDPVQFIDVRDLAEFMIHVIETNRTGIFNVAGPRRPMTASEFYAEATRVINPSAKLTFVDDYDFLTANKIDEAIPWAMLKGNDDGMMSVRNDRAIAEGLGFRPLDVTLRDALAWWPTVPEARRQKPRFTITPETEAKALAAWHARV